MNYRVFIWVLVCLFILISFNAEAARLDNVHLFQAFYRDAPITRTFYGELGIEYDNYDPFNRFGFGFKGGYPINRRFEFNTGLNFVSISYDGGGSESGLSDLYLGGRYLITAGKSKISAGGFLTLPTGQQDVGYNRLDFGGFGALRYYLDKGMAITGTVGVDFYERRNASGDDEYKASLVFGVGCIYPANNRLSVIPEFLLMSDREYVALSCGVDYSLHTGKIRAALGFGLDDGAPDFMLKGGYLHFF